MIPFNRTEYGAKQDAKWIKFVELLCSPDSEFRLVPNFEDKLTKACAQTNLEQTILEDNRMKDLIYNYLSFYWYNNKHQVLISSQVQFWNINKLALKELKATDAENGAKELIMHDKITDLLSKLEEKIARLSNEIYGNDRIIDIAKEQIKRVRSPEQRLKNKEK